MPTVRIRLRYVDARGDAVTRNRHWRLVRRPVNFDPFLTFECEFPIVAARCARSSEVKKSRQPQGKIKLI